MDPRALAVLPARGRFAIGVLNSKFPQNIGTLFRTADAFGAELVFTVGMRYSPQRTETSAASRQTELCNFASLAELADHARRARYTLVAVELVSSAQHLTTFRHPPEACYVLGAEDRGLSTEDLGQCDAVVRIPCVRRSLNVATAGGIVIYDRISKQIDELTDRHDGNITPCL